jgi:hypothetical protein
VHAACNQWPAPRRAAPTSRRALTDAYRWQVASRTAAAVLGAFALASAVSILLVVLLTRSGIAARGPAVHGATLLGFVFWGGAVMWAFHTRSVVRTWFNLLVLAALCGALAWAIGWGG